MNLSHDEQSTEPLVRIDHMGVDFGRQAVLRDIVLDIPRGQTLAVIGESGCGKTVLLKTIIGLQRPTRGTVSFDSQELSKLGERELSRQRERIGFVFQQAALFDSMTIAQNVAFPLRQHTNKSPGGDRADRHRPAGRGRASQRSAPEETGAAFGRDA